MMTSNRPVEDWGKLLGDSAAVDALLYRLFHHFYILEVWAKELANAEKGGPATFRRSPSDLSNLLGPCDCPGDSTLTRYHPKKKGCNFELTYLMDMNKAHLATAKTS